MGHIVRRDLPRMVQLRDWLSSGSPELLAILLDEYQTLTTDVTRIMTCDNNNDNDDDDDKMKCAEIASSQSATSSSSSSLS